MQMKTKGYEVEKGKKEEERGGGIDLRWLLWRLPVVLAGDGDAGGEMTKKNRWQSFSLLSSVFLLFFSVFLLPSPPFFFFWSSALCFFFFGLQSLSSLPSCSFFFFFLSLCFLALSLSLSLPLFSSILLSLSFFFVLFGPPSLFCASSLPLFL